MKRQSVEVSLISCSSSSLHSPPESRNVGLFVGPATSRPRTPRMASTNRRNLSPAGATHLFADFCTFSRILSFGGADGFSTCQKQPLAINDFGNTKRRQSTPLLALSTRKVASSCAATNLRGSSNGWSKGLIDPASIMQVNAAVRALEYGPDPLAGHTLEKPCQRSRWRARPLTPHSAADCGRSIVDSLIGR